MQLMIDYLNAHPNLLITIGMQLSFAMGWASGWFTARGQNEK